MGHIVIANWFHTIVRAIGMALAVIVLTTLSAQAHVLQLVTTSFAPGASGTPPSNSDSAVVFEATSGDISTNILANSGGIGSSGYYANSSAGIFGDVGLNGGMYGVGPGSKLSTEVLIASDEYVNAFGSKVHLETNFIVDGGGIFDFFSTNTTVTFTLEIGATNLGPVGPETEIISAEVNARLTAGFGGSGGSISDYFGGRYTATYTTDANGSGSLSDIIEGGLDLGATFDPTDSQSKVVDIPFSFQSLDLLTLNPGDRLLIAYRASYTVEQNGISEGVFPEYSDPLQLTGNALRGSLVVTPLDQTTTIPGPAALPLFAGGLMLVFAARRRG